MTAVKYSLNDIYAPIGEDLKEFSSVLRKELKSDDALIHDIHEHLLKMSGKFLRPALTLLAARIHANGSQKATRLAAAIELIHTATLVHDDIIDDSELRRNQPSVYYKWGREISIVSGDYLYAKAFLLLAGLEDIWVNRAFAQCAHVICEGEMKQIEKRSDFLMTEREYLTIIHRKTAALFQAACTGGAYFSGASPDVIGRLGTYGFGLGMAFQIVDDCMDLTADTQSLGKAAGLDVYKNDVTLPLLYLFQDLPEAQQKTLASEMQDGAPGLFEKIRHLAIERKAVDKALDRALVFVDEALAALVPVKDSSYKESLVQLANYCLDRAR
jgi:octaprenyl-diphosphate synthase